MYFQHATEIWRDFPELVPGVLVVEGVSPYATVDDAVARCTAVARSRLAAAPPGELPEIQAWRRAFARMGLKPTQYRCAAEALLRRYAKDGSLPRIHPLIDLCNAVSMAYAVPVAVFDLSAVTDYLEVRYAAGDETYVASSGELETPAAGEVIFADGAGRAHARRWTNRQSGTSAIRDTTTTALVIAEAMHRSAPEDVPRLLATLASGPFVTGEPAVLGPSSPQLDVDQANRRFS